MRCYIYIYEKSDCIGKGSGMQSIGNENPRTSKKRVGRGPSPAVTE
jgi:hypothetical protein